MTSRRYAKTYAELIDRTLQNKRFFSPKFMTRLIILVWFSLSFWVLASDQHNGRLIDYEALALALAKIAALGIVCGVSLALVRVFVGKN